MTVKISGNSSSSTPSFAGDDGDSGLHATADQVQLVTNGTVGVTVDSSQNVGIATDNPGTRLDVISTASASTPISRFKSGTAAGDRGVEIASDANSNVFLQTIRGSDNASNFQLCLNPNGGNVGIGTTSPDGQLHVAGAGNAITRIQSTDDNQAIVNFSGSSGTALGQILYNVPSNYMRFYVNSAERMRIDSAGNVFLRQGGGSERVYFTGAGSASIGPASYAASSTTLYIGNAAIQVSSDERIKENIQDTQLDALAAVKQISVKDFTWNDPNDTSYNNRNARGTWTGVIAQELVEILPFVVNAPRNEDTLEINHDSEEIWTLDQSQLCPVLIKAMQQQQAMIETLETQNAEQATTIASFEARISALEGGN